MHVRTYHSYAELPAAADALFADQRSGDLFQSRPWLENAERNALRPGDQLRLVAAEADDGTALLTLQPAIYSRLYAAHPEARVLHFVQFEEQPYGPMTTDRGDAAAAAVDTIETWIRENPRAYDVLRMSPLDPGSPFAGGMIAALKRLRLPVQAYRLPSDRYETTAGLSASEYLARRPRALREALERNTRLLLEGGRGRFHFPCNRVLLDDAWESVRYIVETAPADVEPDPPGYLRSVMTLAADAGALRLGVLHLDDVPVAMQFWVVSAGVGRCLRIWAAQGERAFPIDDILTQLMTVCLLDGDRVAELDFGALNDDYARNWAPGSRERFGLAAFNTRTWRGFRGAVRHVGGQKLRSLPRALWRALGLSRGAKR